MMKRVLVALDDTAVAERIAEMGYKLATMVGGETTLLHVISEATYYSSPNYSPIIGFGDLNHAVETDAGGAIREMAVNYLEGVRQRLGDENIGTIVESGDIGEAILRTAEELKIDLIVMGTHGRRGVEKMLMGSVAQNVLNSSSIPVFVVPVKALNLNQ